MPTPESRITPGGAAEAREADVSDVVGSFELPRELGEYTLLAKIARGGMAEVFYAVVTGQPDEVLAVKLMRANLATEDRFVDMFVREGRLSSLFKHPSIVDTLDICQADGRFFIVMRYISGKDLTAVLRRCRQSNRRMPVPHAIHIGIATCRALHYTHDLKNPQGRPLNIVNRDVSPSNVRISYEGAVKLLDFGIAQAVMQVTSEIGILKGKFAYMSPEQIRGLPVDKRSDIFSTGIVLHEMLTCERLFREESEFVLMEKVRRGEIKPPSAFNKRVPAELDEVVMKALEPRPEDRFQDAAQLAEALEPLIKRYQFTLAEMGEFVRSLFPADYRKEQELLESYVDKTATSVAHPPKPASSRQRRSRPRRRRRDKSRQTRRPNPSPVTAPKQRHGKLFVVAAALLVAAALIMVFVLR